MMGQYRKNSFGFTIVELIVTLGMFGIISVVTINAIGIIQGAQRNERYLDLANTTAKQIIEEARNGQYAALPASATGVTYDRTSEVPSELPNGYATMIVTQTAAMPNFKRLDVKVGYKVGLLDRQVNESAFIGAGGVTE